MTVNVGFSFVVATVVALVEAAVIERVIRRIGGKGLACSFDIEGILVSKLEDIERSLLKVTFLIFLLSTLFESFGVCLK